MYPLFQEGWQLEQILLVHQKINSQSIYYSILNYYKISLKDEKLMISKLQDHVRKNYSIFKHEIEIQNLLKSVH